MPPHPRGDIHYTPGSGESLQIRSEKRMGGAGRGGRGRDRSIRRLSPRRPQKFGKNYPPLTKDITIFIIISSTESDFGKIPPPGARNLMTRSGKGAKERHDKQ